MIVKHRELAVKRRLFFDYFYIVVNASVGWILEQLAYYDLAKDVVENGIGLVSARDDTVVWYSYRLERAPVYRSIIDYFAGGKHAEG